MVKGVGHYSLRETLFTSEFYPGDIIPGEGGVINIIHSDSIVIARLSTLLSLLAGNEN